MGIQKNIYLINDFGYVYKENTDSLTHQKFASKNLKFLDVLKNRQSLLSYKKKFLDQTIKLFEYPHSTGNCQNKK